MTAMTDSTVLAEIEDALDSTCEFCDGSAEWVAFVQHTKGSHSPLDALICTICKELVEQAWVLALVLASRCTCGHVYCGQLSDNFRAVRI